MEKVCSESLDIKKFNISLLEEVFPEVVCDGVVDFQALKQLLGSDVDSSGELYQFTWNGKGDAKKITQTTSTLTLRPCKSKSVNWDKTENVYIEGDNLEVLKILQKSYNRKIKLIYIDPPYNTGNDFVYKDAFNDNLKNYKEQTSQENRAHVESDGRFHTTWLNMMYPRLSLAKNLLRDDGVICISCDDNELANLIKICDEIFGGKNLISIMPRKTVEHIRILADYELQNLNDYVLMYCKNKDNVKLIKKVMGLIKYEYRDEGGMYTLKAFQNSGENGTRAARPNLYYEIFYNEKEKKFSLTDDGNSISIFPRKVGNEDGRWLWSKEKFLNDSKLLEYKNGRIYRKSYFNEDEDQNKYQAEKTWLDEFPNRLGAKALVDLGMGGYFDYSKPVSLMEFLLNIVVSKDDYVMDFFSGSATMAHAVNKLNASDGGNRKFVLVQLPEVIDSSTQTYRDGFRTICDIGEERIRRANKKLIEEYNSEFDSGFRVFKLDTSNIKLWNGEDLDKADISSYFLEHIDPIVSGRSNDDILYEILLKEGMMLSSLVSYDVVDKWHLYSIGMGYMVVCLEDDIDISLINEIGKLKPEVIIFKDSSFRDENMKINVLQVLKSYGIDSFQVRSI